MKLKTQLGVTALFGLVVTVLFLPMIQSLLYGLLIANPAFLYWTFLGVVFAAGLAVWNPNPVEKAGRGNVAIVILSIALFMGLFVGPVISGIYAHGHRANEVNANAQELDTLPNTSQEQVRVLPRSISDEYAESSMQKPQFRTTSSDITEINGTYVWSYGIVPDNFVVALTGNQDGAMYVNLQQTEKDVSIEEQRFDNGRGQLLFNSYRYQSVLHTPLKEHNWQTTFNTQHEGKSYIVHSTTTHEWHFRFLPIPQPYAVPQHGSVEVMDTSGQIESLSPSEAQDSELLKGENYYPYHLAKFNVNSLKYERGLLNKMFAKKGVLEIAKLPEGGNSWPLTVPTSESDGETELDYFIATEPAGSGSGVFEVWVIDGQTGSMSVQSYSDAQIGPQKAVNFVSRQPEVNRLSDAKVVAPVPIVKDGTLYWHAKVVPQSNSGVIYTAFVNAQSGDVTLVDGTQQVYAFLNEEELKQVQRNQPKNGTEVTVVVTNENGEVTRTTNVTVPEGGSVTFEIEDSNNNSTSTRNSTDG